MRVNFEVKRAPIFDIAPCTSSLGRLLWGFHKLPLGSFVVSYKCSNVFLNFRSWNRILKLEDFMLSFLLLLACICLVTHTRFLCFLVLNSDHIILTPIFYKCLFLLFFLFTAFRVIFAIHVFVDDESSIKRRDTLKVYSISFDNILNTQGKRAGTFIRNI